MKNNMYYLKKGFILGLLCGLIIIIRDLLSIGFTDGFSGTNEILTITGKGILVGILTWIAFGIVNVFAKIGTIVNKKSEWRKFNYSC